MTQPPNVTVVCPFLGLPADPQSHFSFPEQDHTCRAHDRPWRVGLTHQASYCLSDNYLSCSRFQAATRALPLSAPLPGVVAPPSPESVSVAGAPLAAPDRQARRQNGRSRTNRASPLWRRIATALLAVGALATLLIVVVLALSPRGAAAPSPTNNVTVPPIQTAPPTVAPQSPLPPPTPSPSPSDVASPTPPPTSQPTHTPVIEPSPTPLIHVVERGETLWDIGHLYGVYWSLIAEANGLEDANRIYPGQELIIPQHTAVPEVTATP